MDDITGKVALVTGAGRGIGRAIALALARAGAEVAVNYRESREAAERVSAEIQALGRRTVLTQADVSRTEDVDRLVAQVTAQLGPIQILVNNAGIARVQRI